MSRPVWIPKAAPGCLEPAPASLSHSRCCSTRQSPPSARSCSHTNPPRHSGRKICSASSGTLGKGEEQVSGVHGEGKAAHPKGPRSSRVWRQPAQHSLTRLPRTHPLPNTHPNAELFLSPLGAGAANHPRKCSWTLRVVTKPWH